MSDEADARRWRFLRDKMVLHYPAEGGHPQSWSFRFAITGQPGESIEDAIDRVAAEVMANDAREARDAIARQLAERIVLRPALLDEIRQRLEAEDVAE